MKKSPEKENQKRIKEGIGPLHSDRRDPWGF